MAVTIYPPAGEVDRLVPPLEEGGERRVYEVLADYLAGAPEEWHLLVQPYMIGNHPDFIVASADHGVTVIEVKDWSPGNYEIRDGALHVYDGRQASWQRMTGRSSDPLMIGEDYRSQISGTYLTPPGEEQRYRQVKSCLVLPRWGEREAKDLLRGCTALSSSDAGRIGVMGLTAFDSPRRLAVGGKGLATAGKIPQHWLERLLARLAEPDARREGRQALQFGGKVAEVARNTRSVKQRRVVGPAGSGKSIGLAARAATLAAGGHDVLLLTFNITLAHYLSDLVARHCRSLQADRRRVQVMHFHGFCKQAVGRNAQINSPEHLVQLAVDHYKRRLPHLNYYTAILVDEGQDFRPDWWDLLRHDVLVPGPNSELLLASDTSQTIYGEFGWRERTVPRAGFSGPPLELEGSYRLPPDLVVVMNDFAREFLGDGALDLPTVPADRRGVAVPASTRRWRDVDPEMLETAAVRVVAELVEEGVNPADVVILASHHAGLDILQAVEAELNLPVEHIFSSDKEERQAAKHRFWAGVPALKGSTIHSYKGWESRVLILCIDEQLTKEEAEADPPTLIYIALTRVKAVPGGGAASVHVVNAHHMFAGFGPAFERAVSMDEAEALGGQLSLIEGGQDG